MSEVVFILAVGTAVLAILFGARVAMRTATGGEATQQSDSSEASAAGGSNAPDVAGVIALPPFIFLGFLVVATALEAIVPLPVLGAHALGRYLVGAALAVCGFVMIGLAGGFRELNAVELRVSIDRIEPQIWRRLIVPSYFNLRELHLVLQAAFGWTNSHLHEFEIGGLSYGDELADAERAEDAPRTFEEMEVKLQDFTREPGATFQYVYDMGDNWLHMVCLEKPVGVEPAPKVARCIEGARARPPEDVGGPGGYQEFLEALLDPTHEDHKQMKRWAGGHFDPEWFDLELINKGVGRALYANLKRRVHQPKRQ